MTFLSALINKYFSVYINNIITSSSEQWIVTNEVANLAVCYAVKVSWNWSLASIAGI